MFVAKPAKMATLMKSRIHRRHGTHGPNTLKVASSILAGCTLTSPCFHHYTTRSCGHCQFPLPRTYKTFLETAPTNHTFALTLLEMKCATAAPFRNELRYRGARLEMSCATVYTKDGVGTRLEMSFVHIYLIYDLL